jgi:hypothetical protein
MKIYQNISVMHFDCFPKADIKTTTRDESTNFSSLDNKTLTKSRPIRLYPTQEQRTTLLKWFEAYRKTYNLAKHCRGRR